MDLLGVTFVTSEIESPNIDGDVTGLLRVFLRLDVVTLKFCAKDACTSKNPANARGERSM